MKRIRLCVDCGDPADIGIKRCRPCHNANQDSYEKARHTSGIKARLIRTRGERCERCGSQDCIEMHHKKQVLKKGTRAEDNLILLCHICHRVETTLERGGLALYQGA